MAFCQGLLKTKEIQSCQGRSRQLAQRPTGKHGAGEVDASFLRLNGVAARLIGQLESQGHFKRCLQSMRNAIRFPGPFISAPGMDDPALAPRLRKRPQGAGVVKVRSLFAPNPASRSLSFRTLCFLTPP